MMNEEVEMMKLKIKLDAQLPHLLIPASLSHHCFAVRYSNLLLDQDLWASLLDDDPPAQVTCD